MTTETDQPVVAFVNEAGRSATITLDWPVTLDGKVYDRIMLKRLTVREVAAFVETIGAKDGSQRIRFPIFVAQDGSPIPEAVLDGLDDDDAARLDEAATSFLPRRFAGAMEGRTPPSGASIERSSAG